MPPLPRRPVEVWAALPLAQHVEDLRGKQTRNWFASDPGASVARRTSESQRHRGAGSIVAVRDILLDEDTRVEGASADHVEAARRVPGVAEQRDAAAENDRIAFEDEPVDL